MNNIFQKGEQFNLQLEGKCNCQNWLSWLAGGGKRKIGALAGFSTNQIMEYLKAAAITKIAYKLEIRIAKNYLLKTLP